MFDGDGIDLRDFVRGSAAAAAGVWLGACAGKQITPTAASALPLPSYFAENFGVTPELHREVLAAALENGGDWADLFFQHGTSMSLSLEDNVINEAQTQVDLGVGIRVVAGDQTGYAFTESLDRKSMLNAARTAAGVAKAAARVPEHDATLMPSARYYDSADWASVDVDRVMPHLEQLNERVRAKDPRVERVTVRFLGSHSVVMLVTSVGRVAYDHQPMTRASLSVTMRDGDIRQANSANWYERAWIEFYTPKRLEKLADEAYDKTEILFRAKAAPAGEMPVALAAGSSGILLHEAIGHGMEADFNRKGVSIFADRIGKPVAEPFVSIVDSGTHQSHRGAINIDDEGNESQTTYLVENGTLRSYLHDRISARHFGVAPTGSGRRQSFRHKPLPRMRSTYMENGPHEREEIFAAVKKGIYAVSFTNGQVDIGGGDYSFYVKNGFLIEDGKLTAPIKDVNIIGNGPESLARISMVANDFAFDEGGWTCGKDGQGVPVSLGLPTVLVSKVVVGGAA